MRFTFYLFLLSITCSFGNTFYVSENGSNNNTGLSLAEAFGTIQYAADLVQSGDTVIVYSGTYVGFDYRSNSGTAMDPVVFMTIGTVIINQSGPLRDDGINIEGPDYVVVDGFKVFDMVGNGNGIRVVNSNHTMIKNNQCNNNAERGIFTAFTDDITIQYNECSNSLDEHGIYVSNSSDRPVIRYNECWGNNNIGIHMNGDLSAGGDGIISDARVYGNVIHDNNFAAGINMDGCLRPVVYNNLIYNNHSAQGIALFQQDGAIPTQEAEIYNNTIIVPSDGRWGILMTAGSQFGTKLYNNIILNDHTFRGCVTIEETSGFLCDYNIVNDKMSATGDGDTISLSAWQQLGFGTNSLVADPKASIFTEPFTNPPNYSLNIGSQALESGTSAVSSYVVDDISGMNRPQNDDFDIGAFEKVYCPRSRVISGVNEPLNGFYFAQDTIYLSGSLSMNSNIFMIAPTIENLSTLTVGVGAKVFFVTLPCAE